MRRGQGFSLIELLIVVAIILIIAAIAIPSLMRARIAANESAIVSDVRTFVDAEATFSGVAGGYGDVTCLRNPSLCYLGGGTVPIIDAVLGDLTIAKQGYQRSFVNDGHAYLGAGVVGNVFTGYCYGAVPTTIGRTGNRSFGGDFTGNIVQSAVGAQCCVGGQNDSATCTPIGI